MEKVMTARAFVAAARRIATEYKTSYMLGPWGWPANDRMIRRACTGRHAADNKSWLRYAEAIKGKGFLFDCVGLIKGILWGWNGDMKRTYGGAGYEVNGLRDIDARGMINACEGVSTNFSGIVPGEVVWMDGHIGIYLGGGVVAESTPRWSWGVQLSTCSNVSRARIAETAGSRTWTKHGRLPWVDYTNNEETEDDEMTKYETLADVPSSYRKTIQKLVEDGTLKGKGGGKIDVSEDMCRILTVLDRRGKL